MTNLFNHASELIEFFSDKMILRQMLIADNRYKNLSKRTRTYCHLNTNIQFRMQHHIEERNCLKRIMLLMSPSSIATNEIIYVTATCFWHSMVKPFYSICGYERCGNQMGDKHDHSSADSSKILVELSKFFQRFTCNGIEQFQQIGRVDRRYPYPICWATQRL